MKIDYVSDLHLGFRARFNENQIKWENATRFWAKSLVLDGHGEVLVLAGDFSENNRQTIWFLEEVANYYEKVYFTYGNHDLYLLSKSMMKKFSGSLNRLQNLIEGVSRLPNVTPLVKSVDTFKGKVFAGDVMWYCLQTPMDIDFFHNLSNDSNYIREVAYSPEMLSKKMYQDSLYWYETLENVEIDVFVSHVPPIHSPFSEHKPNGCYMTKVPFLVGKHWICGHDHLQVSWVQHDVEFHMNAIGYPQEGNAVKLATFEI